VADRLIAENPRLALDLYNRALIELTHIRRRMLLLGRMLASERVASFLIEISDRQDARQMIELPMSRSDIADYLGLSIETVCRELTKFKRDGIIASPQRSDRIELRNREALEDLCEASGSTGSALD